MFKVHGGCLRKFSTYENLKDVMNRLNIRSDHLIQTFEPRQRRCGVCDELGHNIRTCRFNDDSEPLEIRYIKCYDHSFRENFFDI